MLVGTCKHLEVGFEESGVADHAAHRNALCFACAQSHALTFSIIGLCGIKPSFCLQPNSPCNMTTIIWHDHQRSFGMINPQRSCEMTLVNPAGRAAHFLPCCTSRSVLSIKWQGFPFQANSATSTSSSFNICCFLRCASLCAEATDAKLVLVAVRLPLSAEGCGRRFFSGVARFSRDCDACCSSPFSSGAYVSGPTRLY